MPQPHSKLSSVLSALVTLSLLAGCSLVGKRARPTAGDPRNLRCAMEYRPDSRHEGADILFAAWANPWKDETFYMNLPDALFHRVFAPGRHLVAPWPRLDLGLAREVSGRARGDKTELDDSDSTGRLNQPESWIGEAGVAQ